MKNNLRIRIISATITLSVIGSLVFTRPIEAYAADTDPVRIDGWTIGSTSSKSTKYSTTRANYTPEKFNGRVTSGDYDGNGTEEMAMFYDYGNAETGMFLAESIGGQPVSNRKVWTSESFNASAITDKVVSGDLDGDGKDEVIALYDYDNRETGMFRFDAEPGNPNKFNHQKVWTNTQFDAKQIVAVTCGDYNGDGKDEVAVFYDYGNNLIKAWVIAKTSRGYESHVAWEKTQFNAQMIKNRVVSGNFGGNDKDEIALFYDYGNSETGVFMLQQYGSTSTGGVTLTNTSAWTNKSFNASAITSKITATNMNKSEYDSIYAFYDYGAKEVGLFKWTPTSDFKLNHSKIWSDSNYDAKRVEGRVAVAALDGKNYNVLGLYDGGDINTGSNADDLREKIIAEANYWVGKIPYYQDSLVITQYLNRNNPPRYMDCSDFTSSVYLTVTNKNIGIWTGEQINAGQSIDISAAKNGNYSSLIPGDLIIFTWPGGNYTYGEHVGIYMGNGKIIHESGTNSTGGNVRIDYLNTNWPSYGGEIRNSIISIRRIL